MFFSPSTNGFYDLDIHGDKIPADAVEITAYHHAALINGQSQGKVITADTNGFPVLQEPAPIVLTYAQKRAAEYPPATDYLDAVVKGDQAQIDAYIAACLAVKAKYPKPE